MFKKFPVAWMTVLLAAASSGVGIALQQELISQDTAGWIAVAIAIASTALGVATHRIVTPLADPVAADGTPLVRVDSGTAVKP